MPTRDTTFPELWLEQLPGFISNPTTGPGLNTDNLNLSTVAGVTITAGISSFIVTWTSLSAGEIGIPEAMVFYEVDVSLASAFAEYDSFQVASNRFTYSEGEPDTTYYVRVRARLGSVVGAYSDTVSTATSLAQTPNFTPNSISRSAAFMCTPGDTFENNTTSYEEIASCDLVVDEDVLVMIWPFCGGYCEIDLSGNPQPRAQFAVFRDDMMIYESTSRTFGPGIAYPITAAVQRIVPLVTDSPGPGTYTYSLQMKQNIVGISSNWIIVDFGIIALTFYR